MSVFGDLTAEACNILRLSAAGEEVTSKHRWGEIDAMPADRRRSLAEEYGLITRLPAIRARFLAASLGLAALKSQVSGVSATVVGLQCWGAVRHQHLMVLQCNAVCNAGAFVSLTRRASAVLHGGGSCTCGDQLPHMCL